MVIVTNTKGLIMLEIITDGMVRVYKIEQEEIPYPILEPSKFWKIFDKIEDIAEYEHKGDNKNLVKEKITEFLMSQTCVTSQFN